MSPDLVDLYAACPPVSRYDYRKRHFVVWPSECPFCGDSVPAARAPGRQAWTCGDPICTARYDAMIKRWRRRNPGRLLARLKWQQLAERSEAWAKVLFDKAKML